MCGNHIVIPVLRHLVSLRSAVLASSLDMYLSKLTNLSSFGDWENKERNEYVFAL